MAAVIGYLDKIHSMRLNNIIYLKITKIIRLKVIKHLGPLKYTGLWNNIYYSMKFYKLEIINIEEWILLYC